MTTPAFRPTCPICKAKLPARQRMSFAYVELERHLEAAHNVTAVRVLAVEDAELAKPDYYALADDLRGPTLADAERLERERLRR